jgi:hypothetical protein
VAVKLVNTFLKSAITKVARILGTKTKSSQEEIFMKGYKTFLKTGHTPDDAYFALENLYCETNGAFNEKFNDVLKKKNGLRKTSPEIKGVAGNLNKSDFEAINVSLNDTGYFNFEKKLSPELCARLVDFAYTTPAKVPPSTDTRLYDQKSPMGEVYRFDIQDLVNNRDIQEIITDPGLVNIARNYLGCEPIFDFPAMWWSTAFQREASSEAAQLYHFDLDRVKWLKIFFYLNDVTEENGPHCYVKGTHKIGAKPKKLLERGYVRINDEEIHSYYPESDIRVVCGAAGSIFAGDTKCWHKGMNLKSGHRLVLELEYTSSLFGANYPKMQIHNYTPEFKNYCLSNKVFASHITFI